MCNYASELKNSMCNYSQYYFSYRDFFRTNVESYIISNFLHEIFISNITFVVNRNVRGKYLHNMKHLM